VARLEHRLLTDHARTPDLLHPPLTVGDHPVAAEQLNRLVAEVLQLHGIGKEPEPFVRLRALLDVASLHADADVAGDGLGRFGHEVGLLVQGSGQLSSSRPPSSPSSNSLALRLRKKSSS